MTVPPAPGSSRGQPAFDPLAADVIGQVRGQRRPLPLAESYERARLTDEERAEAEKAAADDARVCKLCIGIHRYPGTVACPRVAEAELDADGRIRRIRFRDDARWAKRVALLEDMHEEDADDEYASDY